MKEQQIERRLLIVLTIMFFAALAGMTQQCGTQCLYAAVGDNSDGQGTNQVSGNLIYEINGNRYEQEVNNTNSEYIQIGECVTTDDQVEVISFIATDNRGNDWYFADTDIIITYPDTVYVYRDRHYTVTDTIPTECPECPSKCDPKLRMGKVLITDVLGRTTESAQLEADIARAWHQYTQSTYLATGTYFITTGFVYGR